MIDRRTILAGALGLLLVATPSAEQARLRIAPAAQGGGGGGARMDDWGGTANFALEMTQPRDDLPTGHRMTKAYPGILYEVRIACIGGVYPYLYEITSGAGTGMTVNAATGTISWPNPQSNATPTARCTDTKGTQVSETFTITVTTSGFHFVDAVSGVVFASNAAGSLAAPWRTLEDAIEHSAAHDIIYFKNGVYNPLGIEFAGAQGDPALAGLYIEAGANSNQASSAMWLAYPGHTDVQFDHLYNGTIANAYMIDFQPDDTMWLEGIEFWDCYWKFIGISGGTTTLYKNEFHGQNVLMSNATMVMWNNNGDGSRSVVQENFFHNDDATGIPGDGLGLLVYDNDKMLIEGNTSSSQDAMFSPKADNSHYTVRGNTIRDNEHILSSNLNAPNGKTSSADWCFNNFDGPFDDAGEWGMEFGPGWFAASPVGQYLVQRNTFRARLSFGTFDGADPRPNSGDGPLVFRKNVLVNEDTSAPAGAPTFTHFHELSFSTGVTWSVVTDSNNLKGNAAAGLIDANGLLTGAARTANGPDAAAANQRGHELPP